MGLNIKSLTKIAFDVQTKCNYQVHELPPVAAPVESLADRLDARGFYVHSDNTTEHTVSGLLSGITKETTTWLPEGLSADSSMTFSTLFDMKIQGKCSTDFRTRWVFHDTDGDTYLVRTRRVRGCVYTYVLELICGPEC